MTGKVKIFAVFAMAMGFFTAKASPQFIVHNPLEVAQIVKEIIAEAKRFAAELKHFRNEVQQILKQADQWKKEKENSEKQYNLFEKIRQIEYDYLNTLKLFHRRLEKNFDWENLKLKEINDILGSPLFRYGAGDPYQGLFTLGTGLTGIFPEVKYRDNIYQSSQYKNNEIFRKFFDEVFKEEERMLQDFELRKNTLARVSQLQVESEGNLQKFQKNVVDFAQMIGNAGTQETKYANLPNFLIWNLEMNLELAREYLQQIMVKKTMLEAWILKQVRGLYLEKLEAIKEDEIANNNKKESEAVKEVFREGK